MRGRVLSCLSAGATLLLVFLAAGCAMATSRRGEVEFGRMRLLSAVDQAPRPAEAPDVRYPEVLLAQGVEGTAEMRFVVDDLGVTRDITVVNASAPEFGEAAIHGIRRLRYVPAVAQGKRVSCGVEITLFFRQY